MIKKVLFLGVSLFFLLGCETKFSVNGEYTPKPVVHFLLDQGETYHFLKLNKTFLKDGNAVEYAKDPQNSYFENVVATVTAVKGGNEIQTWTLKDTLIHNKEEGVFYYPNQKLYYFKEANLDPDATYKLKIDIDDGAFVVTGQTRLIQGINITYPTQPMSLSFANANVSQEGYKGATFRFSPSDDAVIYKAQLGFNYVEYYSPTDSAQKTLLWDIGTLKQEDVTSNAASIYAKGEPFYEFLSDKIEKNPDVISRHFRGFDIRITAGSSDLYTYMLSSQPSTSSFVQSKPSFSNVDGGLGIFAARSTVNQYKPYFSFPYSRALNVNSTRELCMGQYTGTLKFCSDIAADMSFPFYCGN